MARLRRERLSLGGMDRQRAGRGPLGQPILRGFRRDRAAPLRPARPVRGIRRKGGDTIPTLSAAGRELEQDGNDNTVQRLPEYQAFLLPYRTPLGGVEVAGEASATYFFREEGDRAGRGRAAITLSRAFVPFPSVSVTPYVSANLLGTRFAGASEDWESAGRGVPTTGVTLSVEAQRSYLRGSKEFFHVVGSDVGYRHSTGWTRTTALFDRCPASPQDQFVLTVSQRFLRRRNRTPGKSRICSWNGPTTSRQETVGHGSRPAFQLVGAARPDRNRGGQDAPERPPPRLGKWSSSPSSAGASKGGPLDVDQTSPRGSAWDGRRTGTTGVHRTGRPGNWRGLRPHSLRPLLFLRSGRIVLFLEEFELTDGTASVNLIRKRVRGGFRGRKSTTRRHDLRLMVALKGIVGGG
jgi:hypothetical protein